MSTCIKRRKLDDDDNDDDEDDSFTEITATRSGSCSFIKVPVKMTDLHSDMDLIGKGFYSRVAVTKQKDKVIKKISLRNDEAISSALSEIYFLNYLKNINCDKYFIKITTSYVIDLELFIITEYGGLSLHSFIQNNLCTKPEYRKRLCTQLAAGLSYLHLCNIVHGDLKPDNIVIKNDVCKIIDFGCATSISDSITVETMKTTFPYRAPELFLSGVNCNEKIDCWSFGCIYSEMIKKNLLFCSFESAIAREQQQLFSNTVSQIDSLRENLPDASSFEVELISRMLSLEPSVRISALEILKQLGGDLNDILKKSVSCPTLPKPSIENIKKCVSDTQI